MKKNFLKFIIFGFVTASVILVCASGYHRINNFENSSVTLNLWTMDMESRFSKYMNHIIENYENQNRKIKIVWKDFSENEIVKELYLASKYGELPDIISLSTSTLVNDVDENLFLNLNEFLNNMDATFFHGILKSIEKDGKLLGIPWYTDVKVLFINQSIMNKSSIPIEDYPELEDEFLDMLGKIRESTEKFGSVLEPESLKNLIFNGLNVFNEEGKVVVNTEEVTQYFEKRQSQFEQLNVPKKFSNFADKIQMYSNGEVAMIKSSFSFINSIEQISKDVYNDTIIFPVPLGGLNTRYSETINLSVLNNGKNFNNAVDFINFIVNEDNQAQLINYYNVLPTNRRVEDIENFLEDNSKIGQAKMVAFKSLENSEDFIHNIQNYNYISGVIEKYSRSIYLDGEDVSSLLREAQDEIDNFYESEGDEAKNEF